MTEDRDIDREQNQQSPADYRDLNLVELQKLADYIMVHSIPQGITISESQDIVRIYMDLLNISLHNLNILRNLNGDGDLVIPNSVREELM